MSEKRYQSFSVTGVANSTVYDSGLESTQNEKKKLVGVILSTSGQAGNTIEVWHEQQEKASILDYNIDTVAASGTNAYLSTDKIKTLELGIEIPVGDKVQVAIDCGATNKNLYGAYIYEII